MFSRSKALRRALGISLATLACLACISATGNAQNPSGRQPLEYVVKEPTQRLELIVNSSRILTMDGKIPKVQVNNPELVRLTPLSSNQIQVSSLKPGVTQINLWDSEENIYTVDVIVFGDARELEMLLRAEFPKAALKIRPLTSSVYISGYVPRPDMVSRIVQMSEDYYPKVINNITVGGVQQVMLKVKVMEVSRSKLRQLGIDWGNTNGNDFVASSVAGLISASSVTTGTVSGAGDTLRFGILNGSNTFQMYINALRQYDLVKILAEPTLTTISGRPASFNVGGEFPIIVPASLGSVSIEYKEFGTRVDFVPIVLGNGSIRLEVRPLVSEIDESRNVTVGTFTVPGVTTRWVDTAVEMQAGQTLALAGLIQERIETQNKGVPWLADMPGVGGLFRRVQESINEIELLIMVTPELVDALDPEEVPACGPGEFTTHPSDKELFHKGYLEVPKCCTDGSCPQCQGAAPVRGEQVYPQTIIEMPAGTDASIIEGTELNPALPRPQTPLGPVSSATNPRSANPYGSQQEASVPPVISRPRPVPTLPGSTPNRNDRNNRNESNVGDRLNGQTFAPKLIGPIGYDVQN